MTATCAQQVPSQSALRSLSAPFVHYEEATGTWQSWDMFTTPPYFHDYRVVLQVTEPDGASREVGAILPGFSEYDHEVRTESFFLRVLNDPQFAGYLDAYAQQVCAALRARSGRGGHRLVVRDPRERLRFLNEIRENGVIANHEEHASKSFTCDG
jgi:hypothetical protein